ncbi:MAG: hypothetical protein QOH08_2288, partial [Chloroflexota bacterium]|nr:hypothetical protein [Chloroflexota bacterium]
PAYADVAAQARAGGWRVHELATHHYSMLTDPEPFADALLALTTS